jgi:hypothetical protein
MDAALPAVLAFPAYAAVTVVAPAGSVVTANLVEPFTRVPVPSTVEPALKVTDPVAKVVAELTTAVNVTDSPSAAGLTDEKSCVVVAAWFTVWCTTADVLFADDVFPLYAAVMAYVPAAKVRVVMVATPCGLSEAVPRGTVPFLNVTVPAGTDPPAMPLATAAVKVIAWPYADGFALEVSVVVVGSELIVCLNTVEVLDSNEESPAYVAVILWVATDNEEVVIEAAPLLVLPVPMAFPES